MKLRPVLAVLAALLLAPLASADPATWSGTACPEAVSSGAARCGAYAYGYEPGTGAFAGCGAGAGRGDGAASDGAGCAASAAGAFASAACWGGHGGSDAGGEGATRACAAGAGDATGEGAGGACHVTGNNGTYQGQFHLIISLRAACATPAGPADCGVVLDKNGTYTGTFIVYMPLRTACSTPAGPAECGTDTAGAPACGVGGAGAACDPRPYPQIDNAPEEKERGLACSWNGTAGDCDDGAGCARTSGGAWCDMTTDGGGWTRCAAGQGLGDHGASLDCTTGRESAASREERACAHASKWKINVPLPDVAPPAGACEGRNVRASCAWSGPAGAGYAARGGLPPAHWIVVLADVDGDGASDLALIEEGGGATVLVEGCAVSASPGAVPRTRGCVA